MKKMPLAAIALLPLCLWPALTGAGEPNEPAVLSEKTVRSGGRNITFRLIEARTGAARPAKDVPIQVTPLPESPGQGTSQEHVSTVITATVYGNGLTHFSWSQDGKEYQAISNADFRLLPGALNFEAEDVAYFMTPLVSVTQDAPSWLPDPAQFEEGRSTYLLLGEPEMQPELGGIDALHVYYDDHKEQLIADETARDAAAANPPPPPAPKPDSVITYWRKTPKSE
jgi:hypothetical protein